MTVQDVCYDRYTWVFYSILLICLFNREQRTVAFPSLVEAYNVG